MNIDNEVFINAFQKEMIRSNNNSEWWKNHLGEQINNLFGNSLEQSTKDAILSSAKAFIESGTLTKTQYFYQTKEISDKKEIFASAKLNEKNHIFNIITPEDKESLINNNEHIKLNDLYKILTAQEIEYENKKEIANLLDFQKITSLKKNYPDLEKMLKEWLGKKYEQIFPPKNNSQTTNPNIIQQNNKKSVNQNELLTKYNTAQNKIDFFNSITTMNEKQTLFNQLPQNEKREILNNTNTTFLNYFYSNAKNKKELLDLMTTETLQSIYYLSSNEDKKFISIYLNSNERALSNEVNKNIHNIENQNRNINNYNQNIINSKNNIINLKNNKKEIKLNIKNSKIIIKSLNKRKDKLEKKLINTALKPESRIAFINKKRLEKINRLTNEINFTSSSIEDTEKEIINLNKNFDKAQQQIEKEKESIKKNKQNISESYQTIKETSKKIKETNIKIKGLSSFHKQLIGKKAYNHSMNNMIMTVPKRKIVSLKDTPQLKNTTIITPTTKQQPQPTIQAQPQPQPTIQQQTKSPNKIIQFSDYSKKTQPTIQQQPKPTNKASTTSQNQQKVEQEFNNLGITYNFIDFINKIQESKFTPEALTKLSKTESQIIQLYFEGLYYQKMVELMKQQQQQLAMSGKSRTLSKGFSNIIIFILSLTIVTLIGILTFLILK
ncbi:MAG: hypothetical protein PUD25_02370 [Bacilli bacterium]|nr:hypothetical protein [Bacilli bacterium]